VNIIRDEYMKEKQNSAAIVIQRCERGKWGRVIYDQMREQEKMEAITRIQAR